MTLKRSLFFILFGGLLLVIGNSCNFRYSSATETKVVAIKDTISENLTYELGDIVVGDKKELRLIIKNDSEAPIIINEVRRFCGCTIPQYTNNPILPKEDGEVKITFTADHLGIFSKSLRVYLSSQKKPFRLLFKGEVVTDKK